MALSRTRFLDLIKVQCRIFSTTFNPNRLRLGNKILRQRLRGPSVASYYPPRVGTIKALLKAYPDENTWDEDEEDRLENIEAAQARGKGAPKKRRSREDSKQFGGKKKMGAAKPAAPKVVKF